MAGNELMPRGLLERFDALPSEQALQELLELLEARKVTYYGIRLDSRSLRNLRRELQRHGLNVESLQNGK